MAKTYILIRYLHLIRQTNDMTLIGHGLSSAGPRKSYNIFVEYIYYRNIEIYMGEVWFHIMGGVGGGLNKG